MSTFERDRLEFADHLVRLRLAVEPEAKSFAVRIGWHASKVSRIETGRRLPDDAELTAWLAAVQASSSVSRGLRNRLRDLRIAEAAWKRQLRKGHRRRQERDAKEENAATLIRVVEIMAVPGPVQTAEYARHVILSQAELLGVPAGDVDAAVSARMQRGRILYEPGRRIEILLAESALGMAVCPAEVMRTQIDRLHSVVDLPTVRFGILPLGVQYPNLLPHGFWLVDDEVVVELVHSEVRVTDPDHVAVYDRLADRLWDLAAEGAAARALLARAAANLTAKP